MTPQLGLMEFILTQNNRYAQYTALITNLKQTSVTHITQLTVLSGGDTSFFRVEITQFLNWDVSVERDLYIKQGFYLHFRFCITSTLIALIGGRNLVLNDLLSVLFIYFGCLTVCAVFSDIYG